MPSGQSSPTNRSTNTRLKSLLGVALAASGAAALARSSVTVYGSVDQYVSHLRSSSGRSVTALEDGALLRSRLGFRGQEDVGGGLYAKFQLEMGINADNGTQADSTRGFDRQSWVGLAGGWGEVRLGRQNGVIFGRGDYIDFTSRTLGSMINNFGVPSRFDNDIAYISPRVAGFLFEAHYAMAETGGPAKQAIYQAGLDYANGPYRVGYAGLYARAPQNALYTGAVRYDNLYANYDYGKGKVYLAFVRSNNSTASSAGNNAGSILGNVGGLVAGNNADVSRFFHVWQLSADYRVLPQLRIGALWGHIDDRSNSGHSATGGAVAGYYDLSKRTTLYAVAERLNNRRNAGFRLAASGGIKSNLAGGDVNGQSNTGVQVGIVHRF